MKFYKHILFFFVIFLIFAKIDIANAYEKCGHLTQFRNDPGANKYSILDPINLGFSINEIPPPLVPEGKRYTEATSEPLAHFFLYLSIVFDYYFMSGGCTPVSSSVKASYFGMPRTDTTNVVNNVKEYILTHVYNEYKYAGSAPVIPVSRDGEQQIRYQCPEGYTTSSGRPPGFYRYGDYASIECSKFTLKETRDYKSITGDFGYGVSVNIPALTSSSFKDIASEDAVIEQIAKTGKMQITVEATQGSKTFDIPATNCVKLSGNGPIKVVFKRDRVWNSTTNEFESKIREIINEGFSNIEPYKSYLSHFSFYADLLKDGNSCNFFQDINIKFVADDNNQQLGYAYIDGGLAIYNFAKEGSILPTVCDRYGTCTIKGRADVVMHEVSHAFAGLLDEYLYGGSGNVIDRFVDPNHSLSTYSSRNCSTKPSWSFRGADNKTYGSVTQRGCSFLYQSSNEPRQHPNIYYRPSGDSLMRGLVGSINKFNVISCGYIIAAIKGEGALQSNAQKYWPECLEMAKKGSVIMDGIPPPNPNTPRISINSNTDLLGTITSLLASTPSITPASQVVIYGNNFTAVDNAVKFTNKSTGYNYEVLEIPSADGKSISFKVPADLPGGTYIVKAGAFNSNWSNELTFNVLAVNKAPTLTFTANPSAVLLGQSSVISWISENATSCVGTSDMDKPPAIWNNPGTSGTFSFLAVDKTSFTLTCTGPGGTVTKSVNITVGNFSSPTVSLRSTAQSITMGQGLTLSWSSSLVSSCRGMGIGDPETLLAWNKNQIKTGSIYITPKQNTSLSLICIGNNGQSASSTVNITVNLAPRPEPSNISVECQRIGGTVGTDGKQYLKYNEPATYEAKVSGGNGRYRYSWSGSEGLNGNTRSITTFYATTTLPYHWPAYVNAKVSVFSDISVKAVSAECPGFWVKEMTLNPSPGAPYFSTISPTSGLLGTRITLTQPDFRYNMTSWKGSNFIPDYTTVVVKKGDRKIYIRPKSLVNTSPNPSQPYGGGGIITFDFENGFPPEDIYGDYSISLQNFSGQIGMGGVFSGQFLESPAKTFTLSQQPIVQTAIPRITSVIPSSGILNTTATLIGTNFNSDTIIIASKGTATYTITPTYNPVAASIPTALSFNLASTSLTESGVYTLKASNKGKISNPISFEVKAPSPTLSLGASPLSITAGSGDKITVSWSATNVLSCKGDSSTISPNTSWTNPAATGSFSFSPTSSTILTLTCVGTGGTVTKSASISVSPAPVTGPSQPTVTLNINPTNIYVNNTATISWSSTDANSCTSTGFESDSQTSGNRSLKYSTPAKMLYNLSCTGPGGTTQRSASLTIRLRPEDKPLPTINLSISPTTLTGDKEETVTVTWSSTNAESCTFNRTGGDKGDDWSSMIGPIPLSGSFEGITTGETSFIVTCIGVGGTSSKTVTVTVQQQPLLDEKMQDNNVTMALSSYATCLLCDFWTQLVKMIRGN